MATKPLTSIEDDEDRCFICNANPSERHMGGCPNAHPYQRPFPAPKPAPEPAPGKVKSDGGSSTYYFLPKGATELNDLIEHKGMTFARGNIFKALYRLGEKDGIDVGYDLNKIQLFLDRMKEMNRRGQPL